MKTSILLILIIYTSISIIASTLLDYTGYILTHSARQGNGFFKVVAIAIDILFPDNDSIGGIRNGDPAGIDSRSVVNGTAKFKLTRRIRRIRRVGVRVLLGVVPSAENIPLAKHGAVIAGLFCIIPALHELGRVVLAAFAVFIKHQPMAFRRVDGKEDIVFDGNTVAIYI